MGRRVALVAAAAAALIFSAAAQAGTFPGRNGRIAFAANGQVFTMRADGSDRRQVTRDSAGAADPDWSATGSLLVYARRDGLVSFVGTTGALRATMSTQEPISDPALSPDGRRIVFTVNGDGLFDGPSIYVANVDGSKLQRLSSGSTPQWSPDGRWIAYVSVPADTGCSGVRLMQPDGSVDHPVAEAKTGPAGICHDAAVAPSFSPDSKRVLYVSTGIRTPHKKDGTDLYTVSIHGGAHKRLTRDDRVEASPVFSPDGKRVAYEATGGRGRQNGIFTISASGGHRHRIAPPHDALSWQPLRAG